MRLTGSRSAGGEQARDRHRPEAAARQSRQERLQQVDHPQPIRPTLVEDEDRARTGPPQHVGGHEPAVAQVRVPGIDRAEDAPVAVARRDGQLTRRDQPRAGAEEVGRGGGGGEAPLRAQELALELRRRADAARAGTV